MGQARYADSVPALKSLADKRAAIGAGEHDGLVIAVAVFEVMRKR